LVNSKTLNKNITIQVGIKIDENVFYLPIYVSSHWAASVVDLRKYQPSGNIREIFVRARTINGNMTIDASISSMLIASEIK